MAENIIDPNSELPPTVPQLPDPEIPPTVPDSELPDPDMANIIPDDLLQIISDSQVGQNITGANHLTVTEAGKVVTPRGQDVVPGMNLPQMALDFEMRMQSVLTPDLMMEIQEVWLGNSAPSEVPNGLSFESLTNAIAFTPNVSDDSVFTNADQLTSLLGRIKAASDGAQQNLFFDADDDDNLIEIRPQDAAQLGGLRAKGGNDKVFGSQLNDIVNGDAGNDQIVGAGGHDLLRGGQGNDLIEGGEGDDLLKGDDGDDCLVGGAGNDVLRGGAGRDVLIGKAGDDMLIGGGDGDFLKGSEGADEFILRADMFANSAALADRICDFNYTEGDRIKIVSFPAMGAISLASVDVNLDGQLDTAILCSGTDALSNDLRYGVVGVIMSKAPSQIAMHDDSISIVGSQDTSLSLIG